MGAPKWIQHIENLIGGMATAVKMSLGHHQWEGLVEGTLQFLGLRSLTPAQAQIIAERLSLELSGFIGVCTEQAHELTSRFGFLNRGNPVLVISSLERLRAMADRFDDVLAEYSRAVRPGGLNTPPAIPVPPIPSPAALAAAPTQIPSLKGRRVKESAHDLRLVYLHAIQMAQHAQKSIGGANASNPFAVSSAIAGTHLLVQWLRQQEAELRQKMH